MDGRAWWATVHWVAKSRTRLKWLSSSIQLYLTVQVELFWKISYWNKFCLLRSFPGGSGSKESTSVQETQVSSLGQEDLLEEEMAIHSSILAWRIPWTEKPGGLQSIGSQRVRNNWVTNTFTFFGEIEWFKSPMRKIHFNIYFFNQYFLCFYIQF